MGILSLYKLKRLIINTKQLITIAYGRRNQYGTEPAIVKLL